jgi:DtxR family Mn-dependent transcriptional regulator
VETTKAVEDYLKEIYALQTRGEGVSNARIAARLGVSAPSVSVMVKRLEAGLLVKRLPSNQLALTELGEAQALRIVRRHRLVETYLHHRLGVPWHEVHDEAEILEHAISDRLEDRIAEALGHPTHDPHGDPIPPKDGSHREGWPGSLNDAPEGCAFRVERVSDRDREVLRYLADLGIRPGTVLDIEQRSPFGGPLWVRINEARHALGIVLVRSVFGSVVDSQAVQQGEVRV